MTIILAGKIKILMSRRAGTQRRFKCGNNVILTPERSTTSKRRYEVTAGKV